MGVVTRVSEEEYLANPEWEKFEYIDGDVVEAYMGKKRHGRAQSKCSVAFERYLEDHPIGYTAVELGCRLSMGGRVFYYLPDVCVVIGDDDPESDYLLRSPDLVVEVRSPGDSVLKIMRRMEVYFANGARLGWIVLPEGRTVLVVSKALPLRTAIAGETLDGGEVLPGFHVEVDKLFS